MASPLHGVAPYDPMSYADAAAALLTACVLAALVPAARAERVDPMTALRRD
jgi:ABC-type lipoprotein release transport system permease subunit